MFSVECLGLRLSVETSSQKPFALSVAPAYSRRGRVLMLALPECQST